MKFKLILLLVICFVIAGCGERPEKNISREWEEDFEIEYPEAIAIEEEAVLTFVIHHSLRIPDFILTIQVLPREKDYLIYIDSQPMLKDDEWKYTEYHREKKLSEKDYEHLKSLMDRIEWKKLNELSESIIGLDGEVWGMRYKTGDTVKSTGLWCPQDQRQKEYRDFLNAAKFLMTCAGLDYTKLADPEKYVPTVTTLSESGG